MGGVRQWSLKQLAESGQISYGDGYRTKKSEHGDIGLPILRVADVLDGRIEPALSEFVRDEFRAKMGPKVSRPGDVVLTTKGTVGRVALVPEGMREFVYSPQVCFFRPVNGSELTARYLYYWLRSDHFRHQAAAMKGQTDMADYLNLADIGALKVVAPALGDQYAIAEVLGALDDKIAVNERLAGAADQLAEACYVQASREQVGWCDVPLGGAARWLS
ncbi:restriction endonuclease subunit S, partial [Streptomyces rubiginosohelvolus]